MTSESHLHTSGHRVVVSSFGEDPPDAIENHLTLQPQSPPDTSRLEPTDVVVAVKSVAVGWVDLLMTSGQYQHMASPPYTPGLEYSGEVVWTGSEVDSAKIAVGDRVLNDGFVTGPRSKGAHQRYGGFATWTVAPAAGLRRVPESFSYDEACNLLGNYETAYHCLIARGGLSKGETVLIHGASGSTGLAAVHIAKLVGARVIATGRSPEKLAVVAEQGADHVLNTAAPEGESGVRRFRDEVKALTDGRGVDVVYDGVGGDISLESLRCVRFGARFLIVGWAATPNVARGKGQRGAPRANTLPTNLMMMKGLTVMGCPTVIHTLNDPSIRIERTARIMAWIDEGRLRPHVSATYPLSKIKEALWAKWKSHHVGGCVVNP